MLSAPGCLWLYLTLLMLFAPAGSEPGSGVKVVVSEGSDAILPCSLSTKESIVQKLFDWTKDGQKIQEVFMYMKGFHYNNGLSGQDKQFEGRVSHFPEELQFGNASIIIRNTTLADSGDYTCDFPNLKPEQIFNIKLVVVASPKPLVGILNIIEDKALLKCEVRGASPKPEVEWRDSDGNILPAEEPQVSHTGERYDITLLTTVTRTNTNLFHCVATQEELSHVTEDKIYVPYCENLFTSGQDVTGWFIGWFIGILTVGLVLIVLVATKTVSIRFNKGAAPKPFVGILNITEDGVLLKCEVRGASPQPKVEWRDSHGNLLPAEEPQVSHTGERYDITLLTTVTRTNTNVFHCVVTQELIGHVTEDKLYVTYCEKLFTSGQDISGWMAGLFIGLLIFPLVLIVLVATKIISIRFNKGCLKNTNRPSEESSATSPNTSPEELRTLRNGSAV